MAKPRTIRQEYEHQRKLLEQRIARAEQAGFKFPTTVMPPEVKNPTRASINRLAKLRGSALREQGTYFDPSTGREVAGRRGVYLERLKASREGQITRETGISVTQRRRRQRAEAVISDYWGAEEKPVAEKKPSMSLEEIKKIEDPGLRNLMWEKWWKETHEVQKTAEETVKEDIDFQEQREKELQVDEQGRVSRKTPKPEYRPVGMDETISAEEQIINTFEMSLSDMGKNARSGEGTKYIIKSIESAIADDPSKKRDIANAIKQVSEEMPLDRQLAYNAEVAKQFVNKVFDIAYNRDSKQPYNKQVQEQLDELDEDGLDELE